MTIWRLHPKGKSTTWRIDSGNSCFVFGGGFLTLNMFEMGIVEWIGHGNTNYMSLSIWFQPETCDDDPEEQSFRG